MRLFDADRDYLACLKVMRETQARVPIGLLAYCLMPNHFHLVVRPRVDGQLSAFMQWFTATHSKRWHAWRRSAGTGAVYQGRFKAFPVQTDRHFLTVCLYVERNALRAGLVGRAEDWPWSSASLPMSWRPTVNLDPWPVPKPSDWLERLNAAPVAGDVNQLRLSLRRGIPYGDSAWVAAAARGLQIPTAPKPAGRPRKWKTTSEVDYSQGRE